MGFITAALAGSRFGPLGTIVGGLAGAFSSGLSAEAQRRQDLTAAQRENESLALRLAQEEELAEIQAGQIASQTQARQNINADQAKRYQQNQKRLARQTVAGAERQMTIMGMQAQAQNYQANQQFIDMQFSKSQTIGQSQQAAAVSGLRNSGSVMNAQTMQESLYNRQIQSTEKQLEFGRNLVEKQLESSRISATEAARQLRIQGRERITATEEANRLLQMSADAAIVDVQTNLQNIKDQINNNIDWNDEDINFLKTTGLGLSVLQSIL